MTSVDASAEKGSGFGWEAAAGPARQYVSFVSGAEHYAIDIMSVREIKGWSSATTLPNQPDYVRGVMNLRGAVLPIIDLKRRLGGGFTEVTSRHVVVIVAIGSRQVGLLVDAVSDILNAADEQIRSVPEASAHSEPAMYSGFLTEQEQMIAMLDLARVYPLGAASAQDPTTAN